MTTSSILTMFLLWLSVVLTCTSAAAEHIRDLEVSEGAPVGTRIGFIGDGASSQDSGPPYLIVPVGTSVDTDLAIDQTTGEIKTKVPLDRETRASYSLVAIPISGDNIKVVVKVLDENDNAPTFPMSVMSIEFPENTPRDVKRTLLPAKDLDLDIYNTQKYNIVSGNVNNAFRLSSHRERDGVLYLDLQINGFLDRETTPSYSLVIEALDGGSPPLRGEMTVNITIQDVNDNQPIFNQSRYFATIPENATVGTSILQVTATDTDAAENGQVEYSINRRQSDRDNMFRIDPTTGQISVNKPLDFETKELHELVIVAKDHGLQPLETTAFVSIRVTDVNDNQPTINVIFLSDDATPKISESAQPGEFVARISVNDPDSKTEYSSNISVTLSGGDGKFGLTTRDNITYFVIVSLALDRELQPSYTLEVVATDTGSPPLHATTSINVKVTDINDNAPEFEKESYQANVMEVSDPGTSVIQVLANDKDEGNNSAIVYSLLETPDTHSSWFRIDSRSGLITTRAHVDCETDPMPRLTVVATDGGFPPLSSSATVFVTIHDVNDNEPIFDQSFYNISVAENEAVGRCIFKVSATDPDCGVNSIVNYTIGDGFEKLQEFEIRSATGDICIGAALDYETRNEFEFPVIATDRGGLTTTAMIKVQITDTNDNRPVFYPQEYNVSLREGDGLSSAVVTVAATDPDSGRFGTISYKISSGNDAGLFRIDKESGDIFVNRPSLLSTRSQPYHSLNISASDGANLKSLKDAQVFISVIDASKRPPIFEQARYSFRVSEDVKTNTLIGYVKAVVSDSDDYRGTRYSIYSGDPNEYFKIDSITGAIRTASILDHETKATVLLNVQAMSGEPPVYGHAQVLIEVEDVNDNPPEFESSTVRISVPENVDLKVPIYAAHARDKDCGANGVIHYKIVNNAATGSLFELDPKLGHLTLTRHLDYETTQRHSIVITATDAGTPSLSANLTVLLEVQDFNDNPPVFERNEYSLKMLESLPVNSQVLQVAAVDLDTGNNARITYHLLSTNHSETDEASEKFGIFPNSGWLYLRETLDREARDSYDLLIVAEDNGTPAQSATTRVHIEVLDDNDNNPIFEQEMYEYHIEENLRRDSFIGRIAARDEDLGQNAVIRYKLIPENASFTINGITGEVTTKEPLDRETHESYDLVAEARDQGTPPRTSRVSLKIHVTDINDNAPEIVDPQEDVVSVREEQSPGTEVVRIRAVDADAGSNASITYAIQKGKDSDGYDAFTIEPNTGVIRTRMVLDHEERTIYRLAVTATDGGRPPKQTIRRLRVEVLDINDNRPTFSSSSLVFKVPENANIGRFVGSVAFSDSLDQENVIQGSTGGHVTYTLTSLMSDQVKDAFDIERSTGSLVVARRLDRETQSEYRLEVRALDTSAMNNPQSSAITVRVDIIDVNDNAPEWPEDPLTIPVSENTNVGSSIYNFTAFDSDSGVNGDLRYSLFKQYPSSTLTFAVDALTGALVIAKPIDYEQVQEYTLIIKATDQASNITDRLTSSVTARIVVLDVNDNSPRFIFPSSLSAIIYEGADVGTVITNVIADDKDSGDNGRITYIISSGNEDNLFALGYDSGVLTIAKPLPKMRRNYVLNLTATDHGKPTLHAFMELKLSVQKSLVNQPKFINSVYHANISEDASVGSLVTKVKIESDFHGAGNLSFYIPPQLSNDTFNIDSWGRITTLRQLDRESVANYVLSIYATDSVVQSKTLFDVATLYITVTDANDHAPEFTSGSCYRISVPENSDTATIHTVVAEDDDIGPNAEVTYSITHGNYGNKFTINPITGEITARSLDRESHPRYHLTIVAHDKGVPMMQGQCNMTIMVEDQNDNDPRFEVSKYAATISEDAVPDTSILKATASDADTGINARIIYSLANESQLFRVDNKSGVILTAGHFDRERKSSYTFLVVATDSGKYKARSSYVPVTVTIDDINDNNPIFTKYPFIEKVSAYIQPGQSIVKVTAKDADTGTNAEIVYSLTADVQYGKFRIHPNSGVITATQSLASENGNVIYLGIIASDKGNPSKSSRGLVEITVGEVPNGTPALRFQRSKYDVSLAENTEQFFDVLQVSAVRSDGRRQRISYSFGSGNEENNFVINSESGMIQVRDNKNLDYERYKAINLIVEAKTDTSPVLHGYCEVIIRLTDQNDNSPQFLHEQYTASISEGNAKGEFVLQVVALDQDEGTNSKILYHIVDGNHDNAFKIEPAFSGILKTNIVLDREIRDTYRLTVIATDEGVPQMTGTTKIKINILDVNDNQPTFPPPKIVTVPEDTKVGNSIALITANDVDTNPALTYNFAEDTSREALQYFSIDRFNGKVSLKRKLDFEEQQEFDLRITASDTMHVATTTLTVIVSDVNDNAPVFSQAAYYASLPDDRSPNLITLLKLNATDADATNNKDIKYSFITPVDGLILNEIDGTIKANMSILAKYNEDQQLIVKASDMGIPSLSSLVPVRIKVNGGSKYFNSHNKREYRIQVPEAAEKGTTVLHLVNSQTLNHYEIVSGNNNNHFEVTPSGVILIAKSLDREKQDAYQLKINSGSGDYLNSLISVFITLEDSNDNAPTFKQADFDVSIKEDSPVGASIKTISAYDKDLQGTPNAEISYDITSGNDKGDFFIEPSTGILKVAQLLDYDEGQSEYRLVIRACDKATTPLCSFTTCVVTLEDVNDNEPKFPVVEYLEFVSENEPIGTTIFAAHATDLDRGIFGTLNYSIIGINNQIDDSWKLFHIDAVTGLVTTNVIFDYEQRSKYLFMIKVTDIGGKSTNVRVRIEVEGKDEFYPQFTERTYKFTLATSVRLPIGYIIGNVLATDRDKGIDGRVVYQLTTQHNLFKINRTTGAILIKKKLDDFENDNGREISIVVTANSGKQSSLSNMTVVEILLDPLADPGTNMAINNTVTADNTGIADWALGLLIAVFLILLSFGTVFAFLHLRNKRNKNVAKPSLSSDNVSNSNNYVDPSAFDTIQIRGGSVNSGNNQFAPPKYDEIPPYGGAHAASSNSGAATTSELSGSEQSGSSGRGSAEDDGEDEEIRMINEGPLQRDSGIHRQNDGDNLSDVSVRNTQEYLARLGIINNSASAPQVGPRPGVAGTSKETINSVQLDSLNIFDEEGTNENDISNFYAKLNDVAGSDRANSADEGSTHNANLVGPTISHVLGMGTYSEVPTVPRQHHQPSMNGSLSSIVHSEEELAGSYNWDYLLDWGPQYQPLAHVFSEIARLKDDTASVKSAASGNSSIKSKNSAAPKSVPPPLITGVAPRSIAMPVQRTSHHIQNQMLMMPRSPINHDASGASFNSSAAMSPSFSPSLSPLAKSPSISPLVAPGLGGSHHALSRPSQANRSKTIVDTELRI